MNFYHHLETFQRYVNHVANHFCDMITAVKQSRQNPYEIVGWIKAEDQAKDILAYRVTATDKYVNAYSVLEIYNNDALLLQFSKEEIKYITTLALLLHYKNKPKYQVVWQGFRDKVAAKTIHLKHRDNAGIIKTSVDELEKNLSMIDEMPSRDAFKLGKEAGILERMREEALFKSFT